jgi:Ca2+-binding RTX toxin-like protein
MAASLLPFQWPTAEPQDWSNQERADLWRVVEKLAAHGVAVEVATGLSEEGDPWCCFIDPEKGEAVAHFARIDGEFIAVQAPRDEVVRGRDLRDVSERLLARYFVPANQNNAHLVEVLGHPVAVLAAFVLTALELSRSRTPDPIAGLQALFADPALDKETVNRSDPAATLAAVLALAGDGGKTHETGTSDTAEASGAMGGGALLFQVREPAGTDDRAAAAVTTETADGSDAEADAKFLTTLQADATSAEDGAESPSLRGTAGADSLVGTAGDDTIEAGAGNDRVSAGDGDDRVYGGAGDDTLEGGAGDDTLEGGAGDDTLQGGEGNDSLAGGEGADTLEGDAGNDSLDGGSGPDSLDGGSGHDSLDGGLGDDTLEGQEGSDTLQGGEGNDSLAGGEGADILVGDSGSDTLKGGADDDMLSGGIGPDLLFGDTGNDTVAGGDGDDTLHGGAGDDSLDGGEGNDLLFSRSGNDTVSGGPGNDTLFNDNPTGRVVLSGDDGQDAFYNLSGDATISGGEGSDIINVTFDSGHVRLENFELGTDWLIISNGLTSEQVPSTDYNDNGDAVLWLDNDISITFAGLDALPDQIL